jgi:hypothetical protein
LYLLSLENGDLEQLTDIRAPGAPPAAAPPAGGRGGRGGAAPASATAEPKGTDAQEALKKEQREMFEAVRDRLRLKEETEAKQKARNPRKPYTLQARQSLNNLQLSPDGKHVTGLLTESANGSKNSPIPWVAASCWS